MVGHQIWGWCIEQFYSILCISEKNEFFCSDVLSSSRMIFFFFVLLHSKEKFIAFLFKLWWHVRIISPDCVVCLVWYCNTIFFFNEYCCLVFRSITFKEKNKIKLPFTYRLYMDWTMQIFIRHAFFVQSIIFYTMHLKGIFIPQALMKVL